MKNKRKFPLSKVYSVLESGPVVLITSSIGGRDNIMPISWLTPLDFSPPLIGVVLGRQSYTSKIVGKTRELAINIPTRELAKKLFACGGVSGRNIDKFKKFGFKKVRASKINAPLIDECYLNIECRLVDVSMVKKYDLFVVKAVAAWIRPSRSIPGTLHHASGRNFIVAERMIKA